MSETTEHSSHWRLMTLYERFQHIVALTLTFVISVIVVAALWQLISQVFLLLVLGALDPKEHAVFQTVFGMIMTLLIAMEFKHSILRVLEREAHIIQVRTVILIALLALSRKFIILDTAVTSATTIAALGFAVLVLGAVYAFLTPKRAPRGRAGLGARGDKAALPDQSKGLSK
jgi:uncharacterized membrane protein (DUF373 family)